MVGASPRYRDDQGRACAIGGLMPDDEYDPDMEDGAHNAVGYMVKHFDPPSLRGLNVTLLRDLQFSHDHSLYSTPELLRQRLKHVAFTHKMDAMKVNLITHWTH